MVLEQIDYAFRMNWLEELFSDKLFTVIILQLSANDGHISGLTFTWQTLRTRTAN